MRPGRARSAPVSGWNGKHNMRSVTALLVLAGALSAQNPSREDVLRAMRKAADFYRHKVSTEGGYHYYYTADLSYGRSEHGEGLTQIEVQREATPVVALAYLDAFEAKIGRASCRERV